MARWFVQQGILQQFNTEKEIEEEGAEVEDYTPFRPLRAFILSVPYFYLSEPSTGANLDLFLNAKPYFIKMNGTGNAKVATAAIMLMAGPTPNL